MVLCIPLTTINVAFADCSLDKDWPNKPCLDMPPYPKSELVQVWDEYHSMKGQQWMEMKKSEMDYAADNKILQKWISYGTPQSGNFQNHNVYLYYFLHGEAPAINGVWAEQLLRSEDRNPDMQKYPGDSEDHVFDVIITHYHVSVGGFLVLSPLIAGVGAVGFFGGKRVLHAKNNNKKRSSR